MGARDVAVARPRLRPRAAWRSTQCRIHDQEPGKRPSLKAAVSRQQSISLFDGVGAHQEIRNESLAWSTARAIRPPCDACPGGCGNADRRIRDGYLREGGVRGTQIREGGDDLRPDNVGGDHKPVCPTAPQRRQRAITERLIVCEDVDQDVRIDGGYQRGSSFGPGPRISRMNASVPPGIRGRIPTRPSRSSTGTSFRPTSRPSASSKSSTVPGRRPSWSRSRLGIVIWPFSLTVVFIP